MLYLTVHKPTCFKCFRPFFRKRYKIALYTCHISDTLTTHLIMNTFQYLFDFLLALERSTSLLSTLAVRNTAKCRLSVAGAPDSNITNSISQNKQRSSKSSPLSLCWHKYGDLSALSLLNYFSPCIQRDGMM